MAKNIATRTEELNFIAIVNDQTYQLEYVTYDCLSHWFKFKVKPIIKWKPDTVLPHNVICLKRDLIKEVTGVWIPDSMQEKLLDASEFVGLLNPDGNKQGGLFDSLSKAQKEHYPIIVTSNQYYPELLRKSMGQNIKVVLAMGETRIPLGSKVMQTLGGGGSIWGGTHYKIEIDGCYEIGNERLGEARIHLHYKSESGLLTFGTIEIRGAFLKSIIDETFNNKLNTTSGTTLNSK